MTVALIPVSGFPLSAKAHLRVSGLGDRLSGTGLLVRVRVRALNLYLVLNTRTRDLTAETWDLRMKSRSPVSP
jgi:hypothetical protein